MLATVLALVVVLVFTPADNHQMVLMVYPLWAMIAALSFFAHATEAGIYYMIGGLLFGCAVIMALTPYWAPLEVACLMTANMTFQAIYLRGLSAELPKAALGAHSATTIKTDA